MQRTLLTRCHTSVHCTELLACGAIRVHDMHQQFSSWAYLISACHPLHNINQETLQMPLKQISTFDTLQKVTNVTLISERPYLLWFKTQCSKPLRTLLRHVHTSRTANFQPTTSDNGKSESKKDIGRGELMEIFSWVLPRKNLHCFIPEWLRIDVAVIFILLLQPLDIRAPMNAKHRPCKTMVGRSNHLNANKLAMLLFSHKPTWCLT